MKQTLDNIAFYCDRVLGIVLIILMTTLVAAVSWQVLSRYLLQAPSSWTEELARFVLIWLGLLGAAYAYRTRAHLGLDLLAQQLSGAARAAMELFVALAIIAFAVAVMVTGGAKLVLLTQELDQYSAVLGVRMALVYLVIPISGLLLVLYGLLNCLDSLAACRAQHKTQRP